MKKTPKATKLIKKTPVAAVAPKTVLKKGAPKKATARDTEPRSISVPREDTKPVVVAAPAKPEETPEPPRKPFKWTEWHTKQKKKLLELRDRILEGMDALERDHLRKLPSDSSGELSHYGTHMADAGSDSYDRDFALSILSQEQDALYEIDEALKRLEEGRYGTCEMSNKPIPKARLEAIPFARYSVECQAQLERDQSGRRRWSTGANVFESFGNAETESGEEEEKE
jgi:RNA polymerase-binding transcription factor DksA